MQIKIKKYLLAASILFAAGSLFVLNNSPEQQKVEIFKAYTSDLGVSNADIEFAVNNDLTEGNVLEEKIAMYPEYIFDDVDVSAYFLKDASIKTEPYDDADDADQFNKYDEIKLTGQNNLTYWEVSVNGNTYYVNKDSITTDKSYIDKLIKEEEEAKRKAEQERINSQTKSTTWNGSVLTKSKGVNYGPSGKETYYNLPMGGVVSIMRSMGNTDPYWVRADGCKMLGNYIMVAANLSVHPRGSLVETSLGTGIVCDTGGFAASNPNQLDIAVSW